MVIEDEGEGDDLRLVARYKDNIKTAKYGWQQDGDDRLLVGLVQASWGSGTCEDSFYRGYNSYSFLVCIGIPVGM